jgi:uncharacterized membrane protein
MNRGRMEAFSDGVLAIIITIMVLELHVPVGKQPAALFPLLHKFLSYILSFVFLGIYWSNHHHLLQAVKNVNGRVLWANLHLLFWLSLVPFVTAWMGDNRFAAWPVALYGGVMLFAAIAYFLLTRSLLSLHGEDSVLAAALAGHTKEKTSLVLYVLALPLSFVHPGISCAIYVLVAVMWLVPDRRIERTLAQ